MLIRPIRFWFLMLILHADLAKENLIWQIPVYTIRTIICRSFHLTEALSMRSFFQLPRFTYDIKIPKNKSKPLNKLHTNHIQSHDLAINRNYHHSTKVRRVKRINSSKFLHQNPEFCTRKKETSFFARPSEILIECLSFNKCKPKCWWKSP
jgi:hypothetical protein